MRYMALSIGDFPERKLIRRFEGGAVYAAARSGRPYLILNQTVLSELADDQREAVKIIEFDDEAERSQYLTLRGWGPRK